jgi:hypothetical protein
MRGMRRSALRRRPIVLAHSPLHGLQVCLDQSAPQVSLRLDLSWSLGPGIQHSADGDALWQWGQGLSLQSVQMQCCGSAL